MVVQWIVKSPVPANCRTIGFGIFLPLSCELQDLPVQSDWRWRFEKLFVLPTNLGCATN